MGFLRRIKSIGKSIIKDPLKAVTIIGSPIGASTYLFHGKKARIAQTVAKAGTGIALAVFVPAALPAIAGVQTAGAAFIKPPAPPTYSPPTPSQGVSAMGFNTGQFLSGIGSIFSQSGNSYLSGAGQIASAFAPAFSSRAQPASFGPVYSPQPIYQPDFPVAQPVGSNKPVIAAGAGAVARITAPVLFRIASKLGKRVSLQGAITMIRKMGKFLMDPTAIAVALGISVGELATLITAHSSRKTRHMNAANGKALRRAARRIKSFHRMCGTIDLLKSRGRRVSRGSSCGTCRKNPCRC